MVNGWNDTFINEDSIASSLTFTPSVESDWAGGTSGNTFSSGRVFYTNGPTPGDEAVRSATTLSGDFELEVTVTEGQTAGAWVGVFASTHLGTFNDNHEIGHMHQMDDAYFYGAISRAGQTAGFSARTGGGETVTAYSSANTDVVKIKRVGSTITNYLNGTLKATANGVPTGTMYVVLGGGGASLTFDSDYTSISWIKDQQNSGLSTSGVIYSSSSDNYSNDNELIDAYTVVNQSSTTPITDATVDALGQSFLTPAGGMAVSHIAIPMTMTGTSTGNLYVSIHGHSGTFGTSSVSNNVVYGKSGAVTQVQTGLVGGAGGLGKPIMFTFTTPVILEGNTHYTWIVDNLDGSLSNSARYHCAYDNSSPTHNGNGFTANSFGTWTAQSGNDYCFYLYGNKNLDLITKATDDLSTTDSPASAPSEGHLEVLVDDRIISPQTQVGQGVGSAIGTMTDAGGLSAAFDGTTSQSNGASAADSTTVEAWLGKDWGSGVTKTISGFKAWSTNNDGMSDHGSNTSGCTLTLYGSNTNDTSTATELGGLTDLNFRQNNHVNDYTKLSGLTTTNGYRYHWVRFFAPNINWIRCAELQFFETVTTYTTLNTDVIGEMSRDGGTTWSPATLARSSTGIDGANTGILSGDVDFTGDPSGTNIVGRIRTANKHYMTVDGISVNWS